jgi:hypothetical protein
MPPRKVPVQSAAGSRHVQDRTVPVATVYTWIGPQIPVPEHVPPQVGHAVDEQGVTPVGKQAQAVGGEFSSGAQCVPGGQLPSHAAYVSPHGVAIELEVVDVLLVVDVDVVVGAQSPPPHASQQLGTVPMHAAPPFEARQRDAPFFTLHRRRPPALVRQQATVPGRPHVDRTAQRLTAPLQPRGSRPVATRTVSTPEAQRT